AWNSVDAALVLPVSSTDKPCAVLAFRHARKLCAYHGHPVLAPRTNASAASRSAGFSAPWSHPRQWTPSSSHDQTARSVSERELLCQHRFHLQASSQGKTGTYRRYDRCCDADQRPFGLIGPRE